MNQVGEVLACFHKSADDPVAATDRYRVGAELEVIRIMTKVLWLPCADWVEQRTFGDWEIMFVLSVTHSFTNSSTHPFLYAANIS